MLFECCTNSRYCVSLASRSCWSRLSRVSKRWKYKATTTTSRDKADAPKYTCRSVCQYDCSTAASALLAVTTNGRSVRRLKEKYRASPSTTVMLRKWPVSPCRCNSLNIGALCRSARYRNCCFHSSNSNLSKQCLSLNPRDLSSLLQLYLNFLLVPPKGYPPRGKKIA